MSYLAFYTLELKMHDSSTIIFRNKTTLFVMKTQNMKRRVNLNKLSQASSNISKTTKQTIHISRQLHLGSITNTYSKAPAFFRVPKT